MSGSTLASKAAADPLIHKEYPTNWPMPMFPPAWTEKIRASPALR